MNNNIATEFFLKYTTIFSRKPLAYVDETNFSFGHMKKD